ncbi:MAG: hypothetical protein BWX84_01861 [Verrucomicrobia bacterium ADurb.Bin118]|nr:MAG: hypothetical protein BWX84_01861 [Verrucomicrobia bacterium ADurb.Bin118]
MMPISWMPLNCVNPIAKKPPAVVKAPVKMPRPVNTNAQVKASSGARPWRNSSS